MSNFLRFLHLLPSDRETLSWREKFCAIPRSFIVAISRLDWVCVMQAKAIDCSANSPLEGLDREDKKLFFPSKAREKLFSPFQGFHSSPHKANSALSSRPTN
jgi:hypothetical protein